MPGPLLTLRDGFALSQPLFCRCWATRKVGAALELVVEGRCGQDEKGGKLSGMSSPHVDVYTGYGGVPGLGHGPP